MNTNVQYKRVELTVYTHCRPKGNRSNACEAVNLYLEKSHGDMYTVEGGGCNRVDVNNI